MRSYRGRHRAPASRPRIAVNAARIAVGGLVLAEITGGFPAVTAEASTPVVLAASHHSTHHKHHHPKPRHPAAKPAANPVAHPAVVQAAVVTPAAQPDLTVTPVSQTDFAAAPEQMLFDHYIVQPGDTLTHIAAAYGLPFEAIWSINSDQVYHPDAIWPGLRLRLPA